MEGARLDADLGEVISKYVFNSDPNKSLIKTYLSICKDWIASQFAAQKNGHAIFNPAKVEIYSVAQPWTDTVQPSSGFVSMYLTFSGSLRAWKFEAKGS